MAGSHRGPLGPPSDTFGAGGKRAVRRARSRRAVTRWAAPVLALTALSVGAQPSSRNGHILVK